MVYSMRVAAGAGLGDEAMQAVQRSQRVDGSSQANNGANEKRAST
jgi:hypothetical protein